MKRLFLLSLVAMLLQLVAEAQTHSVDLSWTQGTCSGCTITGNKVYRSLTLGGPYSVIRTFAVPATSFTDPNLPQLSTYYYVVTAICSACATTESAYSSEVKATTLADPTKPDPPPALTATPH